MEDTVGEEGEVGFAGELPPELHPAIIANTKRSPVHTATFIFSLRLYFLGVKKILGGAT
jgi:hypothetical protein